MNESIRRLEEKIAYLERHVTEQDKAMLELADDVTTLRRELKAVRAAASSGGAMHPPGESELPDERPPHY